MNVNLSGLDSGTPSAPPIKRPPKSKGSMCCDFGQVIEAGLQLVIMLTPIRSFFKVTTQDWGEWLFAILTGLGSLVVSVIVKLATRYAPQT